MCGAVGGGVQDHRPSHKELSGKLRKARQLLTSRSDGYRPVDQEKLGMDFYSLELFTPEEQVEALRAAFAEVKSNKYCGHHPPDRAFETVVKDEEIFTFKWQSGYFSKKMYLKFCFCDSVEFEGEELFVFSLHEDQPERRKGSAR